MTFVNPRSTALRIASACAVGENTSFDQVCRGRPRSLAALLSFTRQHRWPIANANANTDCLAPARKAVTNGVLLGSATITAILMARGSVQGQRAFRNRRSSTATTPSSSSSAMRSVSRDPLSPPTSRVTTWL